MKIVWIRRPKKEQSNEADNKEAKPFTNHDEDMRSFRLLHQELETYINKDIISSDGSILAPIHAVRLAKHSQN